MLPDNISDEEFLYRRIRVENQWDKQNDRPSSAAFKDSNGLSVDRLGERTEQNVIISFKIFDPIAIAKVKVAICREKLCHIKYDPITSGVNANIYHTLIHRSTTKIELTDGQAKYLSKNCSTVYKSQ
jgi:hypothetical protein